MINALSRGAVLQIAVAAGLFLFAAVYLNAALGFSFGSWSNPKAGFLPTIVGGLGTALGGINLVWVIAKGHSKADVGEAPLRAVLGAFALLAYVPVITLLGYLTSTFLVLTCLIKLFGARGWIIPLAVAAGASALTFILFEHLLELPLP